MRCVCVLRVCVRVCVRVRVFACGLHVTKQGQGWDHSFKVGGLLVCLKPRA